MGVKPWRFSLGNDAEVDRWARKNIVVPSPASVTATTLAPGAVGTPAIAGASAAANGTFYKKSAGTLIFSALVDADIPAAIARDAEVTAGDAAVTAAFLAADTSVAANAATALTNHEAAANPHPGYLTPAEGDAAYQPLAAVLSMLHTGTGSPETVVTAPVGHLFLRSDGGAGTTLYVKESGVGNTGWIAK